MATICLTLALAFIAILTGPVRGQTYPVGVPQISISPPSPTTNDVVFVTIRGTHNDSCVPEFDGGGYGNFVIEIDLVTCPPSQPRLPVLTDYEVGPISTTSPLVAGFWQVRLFLNGQPFGTPFGFTVVEGGGGGGFGPQISISPASPTDLDIVSITIRGTHNDSCVPEFDSGVVGSFVIQIDLVTCPSSQPRLPVLTDYEVGPLSTEEPLMAGDWEIRLSLDGQPFGTPFRFTVQDAFDSSDECQAGVPTLMLHGRFRISGEAFLQGAPTDFYLGNICSGAHPGTGASPTAVAFFFNFPQPREEGFISITNNCDLRAETFKVEIASASTRKFTVRVRDMWTGIEEEYSNQNPGRSSFFPVDLNTFAPSCNVTSPP